eukprot:TRINITY_DN5363_c0_g1_i1.p1 TRINITY_DN5363_c0_g1~~TRINITY_DN5363_c0_g1_i1.p1  ORF type:complete len:592 (-),score=68.47 TRINITY_DN5363_c0_g1_i1:5-1780(-)
MLKQRLLALSQFKPWNHAHLYNGPLRISRLGCRSPQIATLGQLPPTQHRHFRTSTALRSFYYGDVLNDDGKKDKKEQAQETKTAQEGSKLDSTGPELPQVNRPPRADRKSDKLQQLLHAVEFNLTAAFNWRLWRSLREVAPSNGTFGIIILCELLYLSSWFAYDESKKKEKEPITAPLVAEPTLVWKGEAWRLLTSSFVHENLLSVVFNVPFFLPAARALELQLGTVPFLGLSVCLGTVAVASQIATNLEPFSADKMQQPGDITGLTGLLLGLYAFGFAYSRFRPAPTSLPKNVRTHLNHLIRACFSLRRNPSRLTTEKGFQIIGRSGTAVPLMTAAVLLGFLSSAIASSFTSLQGGFTNTMNLAGIMAGLGLGYTARTAGGFAATCVGVGMMAATSAVAMNPYYVNPRFQAWEAVNAYSRGDFQKAADLLEPLVERAPSPWAKAMYALSLVQIPGKEELAFRVAKFVDKSELEAGDQLKIIRKEIENKLKRLEELKKEKAEATDKHETDQVLRCDQEIKNITTERPELLLKYQKAEANQPWYFIDGKNVATFFEGVFHSQDWEGAKDLALSQKQSVVGMSRTRYAYMYKS